MWPRLGSITTYRGAVLVWLSTYGSEVRLEREEVPLGGKICTKQITGVNIDPLKVWLSLQGTFIIQVWPQTGR